MGACGTAPTTLALLPGILPDKLGFDDSHLYAITSIEMDGAAAQSLWRIPKDGSPPQRLVTARQLANLVLYGLDSFSVTAVVWTTEDEPAAEGGVTGGVWWWALPSNNGPVLLASGRRSPSSLAMIGQRVYWAEEAVDSSGLPVEEIMEVSTSGGPVARVQTLDANQVLRTLVGLDLGYVQELFWTMWNPKLDNPRTAQVVESRVPAPFAPQTRIVGPDAGGAGAIALNPFSPGILYSGPTRISGVTVAADGGVGQPRSIAATGGFVDRIRTDGAYVYFVDGATGNLMAAPRPGADAQAPRTLVRSVAPATAFQVDSACVYWVDAPAGAIKMVTKEPVRSR